MTRARRRRPFSRFQAEATRAVSGMAAASALCITPILAAPLDAMIPTAPESRADATTCLAQAISYEAGNEPEEGQEAVAQVVLNRVHDPAYPKTVCDVVFQGATRRSGCQFTFTCDGSLERRAPGRSWANALRIADLALDGRLISPVGDATHYHAYYVTPAWAAQLVRVARIGAHIFYSGKPSRPEMLSLTGRRAAMPHASPATFSVWGLRAAVLPPRAGAPAIVDERAVAVIPPSAPGTADPPSR